MNLSTSSNIHQEYDGNPHYYSLRQSIAACSEAGFSHIDITWHGFCDPDHPFGQDGWKRFVEETGRALERHHLVANQSHTVFYLHQGTPEHLAYNETMVRRCLEANNMLSIPVTVMHILRVKDLNTTDKTLAMEKNIEYFKPYGDLARKNNTRIAIENGLTGFYHSADELLELIYRLGDDAFGLCWDTGHANITGQDQARAIRKMGDSLLCVHINDNNAQKDQHLLPFFGNIQWGPIMQTLDEIGFSNVLTFESPGSTSYLPPELRGDVLRLAVRIGERLAALAD